MQGLRNTFDNSNEKIRPILVGAAISGLFAIFYDENEEDYFRVKEIPDTKEARQILQDLNLKVNDDVSSMKVISKASLAKSDKRSNIA